MAAIDWNSALKPLLKQYKGRKHPLDYASPYQLLVMVILSAQDSDRHINGVAPAFFGKYPDMKSLAKANESALLKELAGVRSARNKAKWLMAIATKLKQDGNIPRTMDELTTLPGIGRKSANVILRELGAEAEGIMVDLHVVRVAPRIGIATGSDPKKLEQQMMDVLDRKLWGEAGMAMSFLGREICRPSNPKHEECVMSSVCAYCREHNPQACGTMKSAAEREPRPQAEKKPKPKAKTKAKAEMKAKVKAKAKTKAQTKAKAK